ncbi:Heat shock protein [Thalictrum thalictroides]|uniref:Heat shock protein n=1 Tax=Thalictrum thalictroides TaxID=46969 RepID=A0A7J6WRP1_THATH|nr:Heat shock protein [Thalictrum thalictroides]
MKVHPVPKKRNISFHYDINSTLSEANRIINRQKKLRRLPHIFNKVLELPFHSDADVLVEENPECFRFVVTTEDVGHDVQTQTMEIYPGVTKIVLRGRNVLELDLDELELDLWRFRLPPSTKPELASAVYVDGELIVTVPKDMNMDEIDDGNDHEEEVWGEGNGDLRGGVGRLVLVQ